MKTMSKKMIDGLSFLLENWESTDPHISAKKLNIAESLFKYDGYNPTYEQLVERAQSLLGLIESRPDLAGQVQKFVSLLLDIAKQRKDMHELYKKLH